VLLVPVWLKQVLALEQVLALALEQVLEQQPLLVLLVPDQKLLDSSF
jgi:hypothetical protein